MTKKTLVLDVDDTLYPMDCGLRAKLGALIERHANACPDVRARSVEWIGEDRIFQKSDLSSLFPRIVMMQAARGEETLRSYLCEVYGEDYSCIQPDPALVQAIYDAEDEGIRIVMYTNGPSARETGHDMHVQTVLRTLGFHDDFIDRMRAQTYDLLMSVQAGAGKPTEQGMYNSSA